MTGRSARLTGGLAGAAVLIAALTVLARVAGFGRTVVFSQAVGKSCLSDAYFTANQVPNIVFEIVAGGALATLVVPVLAGPVDRGDREVVRRTVAAMVTWVVVLLLPLSLLAAALAGPVMSLLVQGDQGGCDPAEMAAVGARMLVVFAPQIVLYGLAVVLYGVLQAHRRFTAPALAPLVSSLVVIAAYLAYVPLAPADPDDLARLPSAAELTLSVGTTLGVAALVVTAVAAVAPLRPGLRPTLRFPAGVAGRARGLAVAGLATVAAQQLAVLAVVVLKGRGTVGALTDYNYAWAVFLLPWAILAVPIATSAFPVLSARVAAGDHAAFDRTAAATTRAVLLASGAGAAVLAAVAVPAAHFLDSAPGDRPEVLARAIVAFAPGLLGYGLVAHLGRALFACDRNRAAAGATVAGWLAVVVADVVLVAVLPEDWVVAAFGLGNTVGMTVAGVLLLVVLVRARGPEAVRGLPRAAGTGVVAGTVGGLAGYAVAAAVGTGGQIMNVATAALAALAAGAVFLAVAFPLDGGDLRAVLGRRVSGGTD
ncbi:virulence factor MviN [Actinomadura craniellae]|uniref:Virulence factor MviN n=1 Tax=Actinomadura craniellae TaxID=2231787 RepID=A0A365H441_9ACTN|nr:lipid II flippase MurJ [Actinomadura craniellae]RAY13867.1 virulence factor MviN [Actinomadura craniellae]